MKLYAVSQQQAQEYADRAHAYLIETSASYAQSVRDGYTLRWCYPVRDDAGWYIAVEDKCLGAFTEAECLKVEGRQIATDE